MWTAPYCMHINWESPVDSWTLGQDVEIKEDGAGAQVGWDSRTLTNWPYLETALHDGCS